MERGYCNGKGKVYYKNGSLMGEVEVLYGRDNGKLKIYYKNGKLWFEGECLKGRRWNGKEYDENGKYNIWIK